MAIQFPTKEQNQNQSRQPEIVGYINLYLPKSGGNGRYKLEGIKIGTYTELDQSLLALIEKHGVEETMAMIKEHLIVEFNEVKKGVGLAFG